MPEDEVSRALGFLDSLINYEKSGGYAKYLDRFLELLDKLGNPQRSPGTKITVAGTKGKGSVVAQMERGLLNAGYSVGVYTSPHLLDLTERIRWNGNPIPREELSRLILRVKPHIAQKRGFSTWFEAMSAAAFLFFQEKAPDFWLVEVGLGGRLDTANALRQDLTLITRLGLDHTHILGETLPEIAREKAGVIKGEPVVTCPQEPGAMEVLREAARQKGSRLEVVDYRLVSSDLRGNTIARGQDEYFTPLVGSFQAENLALAVRALELLGIERPDFSGARHPGRFQVIAGEPTFVLDGAHNPMALSGVLAEVKRLFPDRRLVVIFGTSRKKDTGAMLALLRGAKRVFLTRAQTPRAAEPFFLEPEAQSLGLSCQRTRGLPEAIEKAGRTAGSGSLVLITGSLYLAGEALRIIS